MLKGSFLTVAHALLLATSALAQTTAPGTGGTPGTRPPGASGVTGGLGSFWWIILVVIAVAAIWYFMRGRNRP